MKKVLSNIGTGLYMIAVVAIGFAIGVAVVLPFIEKTTPIEPILGGSQESRTNKIGGLTHLSTSTRSFCDECPVKLLSLDNNRRYALIQNNSAVDVYLFATTSNLGTDGTGDGTFDRAATTTITAFDGIRLAPNDSDNLDDQYVIGPDNLIFGNVWATSSGAVALEILVHFK